MVERLLWSRETLPKKTSSRVLSFEHPCPTFFSDITSAEKDKSIAPPPLCELSALEVYLVTSKEADHVKS